MNEKGEAKRIIYAWGTASADDLKTTTVSINRSEIAIHVDELFEAYRLGVLAFTDEISENSSKATHVFKKANNLFTPISEDFIDYYLKLMNLK